MTKRKGWIYAAFIGLTEAVGALSALLTREGMQRYEMLPKSRLTPPGIVFFGVWTVLYALMGIGAARVYLAEPSPARNRGLGLFGVQLIVNFFWSLFFFNLQAFGFSLLWLILLLVLVAAMLLTFRKADPLAGWLQLPYLLWLLFAAYLNYTVWQLNF
jgi:tryptophan-rich sensory protein